jgi:hypothetical protein
MKVGAFSCRGLKRQGLRLGAKGDCWLDLSHFNPLTPDPSPPRGARGERSEEGRAVGMEISEKYSLKINRKFEASVTR